LQISTVIYLTLGLLFILTATNIIPVKIWLTARFTKTKLPLSELIFMKFRGLNPDNIGMSMITASKGGLDLTHFDLQVYELAGGDSRKLVRALLIARRDGIPFTMKEANKALESKIDPEQLVNEAVKKKESV
jgi:uncharacterized protein YqfA (UPF0365 family)